MGYRLDIQGLRAIAVLAVLVFHAGLTIPGGFLGVDIFFVISGFVVGGLLLRNRYSSFRDFWLSRFLRLAPAASVLIVLTVAVVVTFFWSERYLNLPVVGLAGLFSVANIALAREGGDYFDPTAEANPLLHIWSLSVEEQIYLFLPIFIAVFLWLEKRHRNRAPLLTAIFILGLVSFFLAVFGSSELRGALGFGESLFGFYSPISRLWEFMAGLYLAQRQTPLVRSRRSQNVLSASGAVAVGVALFLYTEVPNFSIMFSLVAVLGTMALIGAPGSWLGKRLLSNSVLVWIGDRSYSIYLWHWPFVILSSELWPGSTVMAVAATILSLGPAYLSHRFLEVPFRGLGRSSPREVRRIRNQTIGVLIAGSLIVSPTLYLTTQDKEFRLLPGNGLAGDVRDEAWFAELENRYGLCTHPVTGELGRGDGSFHHCIGNLEREPPDIVLLGDSHAAHFYFGVAEMFPSKNVMFLGVPYQHFDDVEKTRAYQNFLLSQPVPPAVFVSYRWEGYQEIPTFADLFVGVGFSAAPHVFVMNGLPTFPMDPVSCKNGYGIFSLAPDCDFPEAQVRGGRLKVEGALHLEINKLASRTVLDSYGQICENSTCSMERNGFVLYADHHHLNLEGSLLIVSRLEGEIRRAAVSRVR